MSVVGIVGTGAMGSAVGARLREGGARVVTTLDGRSERSRVLARTAGLELLAALDDVVAEAPIVLSIVPPGAADDVAIAVVGAATRVGARPLVADLNAISPARARRLESILAAGGLDLVDGSISGPPPTAAGQTRIYLSGARAEVLAALAGES